MVRTRIPSENSSCPFTLSFGQFISWPRSVGELEEESPEREWAGPLQLYPFHALLVQIKDCFYLLLAHVCENSGARIHLPCGSATFSIWLLRSHSLQLVKGENTSQDTHGRMLLAKLRSTKLDSLTFYWPEIVTRPVRDPGRKSRCLPRERWRQVGELLTCPSHLVNLVGYRACLVFLHGCWDLTPGSCASEASSLLSELSPQPLSKAV